MALVLRATSSQSSTQSLTPSVRMFAKKLFGTHLLATNTGTFCILLGAGDFMQQKFTINSKLKEGVVVKYDWFRTARMAAIGIVLGPMNHFWYKILDKQLPGNALRICSKKILCDQLISPGFSSVFIAGLGIMEGQTMHSAFDEYKRKFWKIYAIDWTIWPPMQLVNFLFLPPQYRVLYISTIQLAYNSILSYIKHEE